MINTLKKKKAVIHKIAKFLNLFHKLKFNFNNKNNKLLINNSILYNNNFYIKGLNNTLIIKDQSIIRNCSFYILGDNNTITLGEKIAIREVEFHMEDNGNSISVGRNTTIHGNTHLAAIEGTNILIGNDCMFSGNIVFRTGDSHSILDMDNCRVNKSKDINIADHVWVGNNATVLKGSDIPRNSILATGTIVGKKFIEENIIVGGIPGSIIKRGISWCRERK